MASLEIDGSGHVVYQRQLRTLVLRNAALRSLRKGLQNEDKTRSNSQWKVGFPFPPPLVTHT